MEHALLSNSLENLIRKKAGMEWSTGRRRVSSTLTWQRKVIAATKILILLSGQSLFGPFCIFISIHTCSFLLFSLSRLYYLHIFCNRENLTYTTAEDDITSLRLH